VVLIRFNVVYSPFQHDSHRKPQGLIILDESCRVSRAEAANTFEIATSSGKTYYLTADSGPLMEEWVRVLQNVIQRNALKLLLSRVDQKPTLAGWITKVKHGHGKKCWGVLIGKMFIYFKTPNDQVRIIGFMHYANNRTVQQHIHWQQQRMQAVKHINCNSTPMIHTQTNKVPSLHCILYRDSCPLKFKAPHLTHAKETLSARSKNTFRQYHFFSLRSRCKNVYKIKQVVKNTVE
jgi:hypothetical protein